MTTVQARIAAFPSHIAIRDLGDASIIMVQPGVVGYWRLPDTIGTLEEADAYLARLFGARAATSRERWAAQCGSMYGWDVPAADPNCDMWDDIAD
jgi:hypothetical protein